MNNLFKASGYGGGAGGVVPQERYLPPWRKGEGVAKEQRRSERKDPAQQRWQERYKSLQYVNYS